ncbi:HNH endonuclease signature motif containing protein [Microbacterium sp. CIAB417]|uniref:HNH endonuclease signature motif containing protein n=1 Tax=Microbacterium sp. CIAB417 TaxID=2860287 RepID=UPI001FACC46D|nr:HNH endonuclease signature motif containing protein [Microbacterium sp. CIAB417]
MNHPLEALVAAVDAARTVWGDAADASSLTGSALVAVSDALGVVHRLTDAAHSEIAARIAEESRTELGAESLARQHGFRNAALLVAAGTGGSTGDASRLVKVGEATAPRSTFGGGAAPARHPHVAEAVHSGRLGAQAAARIVAMLDRVAMAAGLERMLEGERLLAEQAPGLSLDQVAKLVARVEAWLDPDGVEPREADVRAQESVTMFERDGALHLTAVLSASRGAQVKTALDGFVSAQFAAASDGAGAAEALAEDRRTVSQLRADALVAFAEHVLGCAQRDVPLNGARVVVRIDLAQLESGVGSATIDGIDQPISVAEARRLAAGGGIIPWVCGGDGEILDWGREKRLFTLAQRLALAERDGGCAMCGLPPSMTKAHHLRWWNRDAGPTDLANGVLLCESCHHRIHDNGWEIRVDGAGVQAKVWFIPPPHVDSDRTPRLGGRARYDLAV